MLRNKNKNPRVLSTCHINGSTKTTQENEESENKEEMWEKFEQELKWCVWKLEKQLSSKGMSQKQAEQTTKSLKLLINPKNSLIKKRALMRSLFGDYRKLMSDEEAEFDRSVKEMAVTTVKPSDLQGIFYKKSQVKSNGLNNTNKFAKSDNSFKFNFDMNFDKNGHK